MFIHEHLKYQPQRIGQTYPALKTTLCIQYLVIKHRVYGKLFMKERINQAYGLKHLSRGIGVVKAECDASLTLSRPDMAISRFTCL